ncbi:Uncharacterised protein [Klebsiella pneumoniae]|nr:Uncharacterised protein [Klebsiella pneumoniae]
MQPVAAAQQRIGFLPGLLLPLHGFFRPLEDPVAAAIADDGIEQLRIGSFGLAHHNARLHIEDLLRSYAAPDPHQTVDQTVPVIDVIAAQRRLHRLGFSGRKPTHQRRSFGMFEARFKQRFAEVSL